jgi:hypothetical protein
MRHLKDMALVVVTIWAAFFAAGVVCMLIPLQMPDASDDFAGLLYYAILFVTAAVAGGLLMTHLHWPHRFLLLAVAPCVLTIIAVVARAYRVEVAATFLERLYFMLEAHLAWFVAAAAILAGAVIARWRDFSEPNETIEPTR